MLNKIEHDNFKVETDKISKDFVREKDNEILSFKLELEKTKVETDKLFNSLSDKDKKILV